MPRRQIAKAGKPEKPFTGKRGRKLRDMTPVAASSPIGAAFKGEEAASKAAARWDQATDAVRFDWPAIEQIASRQGPNQGMAKLLVAARAEGANSRWPL